MKTKKVYFNCWQNTLVINIILALKKSHLVNRVDPCNTAQNVQADLGHMLVTCAVIRLGIRLNVSSQDGEFKIFLWQVYDFNRFFLF